MGKRSKKAYQRGSLDVLRDLGQRGGGAISDLATTVKGDAPTLVLGSAKSAKAKNGRTMAQRFGRFAQSLSPRKWTLPSLQHPKVKSDNKQQPKISTRKIEMNKPKKRRSRLPFVLALLATLTIGAGAYIYNSVSLPKWGVSKYLDHNKWLGLVSGKLAPEAGKAKPSSGSNSMLSSPRQSTRGYTASGSQASSKSSVKKAGEAKKVSNKKITSNNKRSADARRQDKKWDKKRSNKPKVTAAKNKNSGKYQASRDRQRARH